MKHLKTTVRIIALTLALAILWSMGLSIANNITDTELSAPADPGFAFAMLLLASLLITLIMYWFAINIHLPKRAKFMVLLITHFALQFALPQMETGFYLDQMTISEQLIINILVSGFVVAVVYSLLLTVFTYKRQPPTPTKTSGIKWYLPVGIGVLLYPVIYFLFGYFVAWQFEEVRLYYANNTHLDSFVAIMSNNFSNGIYWFQVLRGVIWAFLGLYMYQSIFTASLTTKILILGGLFALVMNAQLLLPNAVMPDTVRLAHALETATSNFLWGALLALFYHRFARSK